MLWYKVWRESQIRFWLSAAVIGCMCLGFCLLHAQLFPGVAHDHPAVRNYTQYIHWSVFGGTTRGMMQLTCLLLGLGGLQRDRKQDTLGFTLALPVSRVQIVLTRALMGFAQILLLAILLPFVVTIASLAVHQHLPLSYGLHFVPLWAIGGILTYSLSFLLSVIINSEYVSLAVAYMVYMFYLAATRHPSLGRFHLHVADFMSGMSPGYLQRGTMLWGSTYPSLPLLGFSVAAMVLVSVATFVTTKQDL